MGRFLIRIVTVVSVSCWCAMEIYVFSCGLNRDSMKNSSNVIYEDRKLLKFKQKAKFNITFTPQKKQNNGY